MATTTESEELIAADAGGEALFEMTNIRPDRSGLPFIVWMSARGHARHDVRVKIAYPPRAQEFVASVSVRPEIEIVAGAMPPADLAALRRWIALNRDTLIAYWDGTIQYTEDAMAALLPIEED